MVSLIKLAFGTLRSCLQSRHTLAMENLALRHQIAVLKRRKRPRPKLGRLDRMLWVWLSRKWSDWRRDLVIVKPDTVVRWHRASFKAFWRWKSRKLDGVGRPAKGKEVIDLIRKLSKENPLWGAPHIHAELEKLGIDGVWIPS